MLTTNQSFVQFQGNGLTTVFPYNFCIPAAGNLVVMITNNNVSPSVSTVLQASQYSVTGIGNATGGNVTYGAVAPLPTGWTITIARVLPILQNTSLSNQGALYPQVVESSFDYVTMLIQQLAAALPSTGSGLPVTISSPQTLTVNSATPSIESVAPVYVTANTQATTITGFTGLTPGYVFAIMFEDTFTTVAFGTGIKGNNSQSWSPQYGDCMICISDGSFVAGNPSEIWSLIQSYVTAQINTAIAAIPGSQSSEQWTFRNRLINGEMRIDQRNAGASQSITTGGGNQYTVDRWYATAAGNAVTGQQVAGSGQFKNYYQLTGATSNTGFTFGQRIEARNIMDLAGQNVFLSAWIASSSLTSLTWTAYYAGTADTWTSPTQIATGTWNISSSLTQYQAEIALPAGAVNGVAIVFSGAALGNGVTLDITGVQLEAAILTAATPFERRPDDIELMRCQRYLPCWRSTDGSSALISGQAISTITAVLIMPFLVPTRIPPTGFVSSSQTCIDVINSTGASQACTAISITGSYISTTAIMPSVIVASGLVAGNATCAFFNSSSAYLYFTGCEL